MDCKIELPFTDPYLWMDREWVCHLMGRGVLKPTQEKDETVLSD